MVGSISGSRYAHAATTSLRNTPHANAAVKAAASIDMSGAAILGDSFINMAYLNGTSTDTAVMDLFSSDSSTSTASLLDYTV